MNERVMTSPLGELELSRYPRLKRENLQAWDAADEFLLAHLVEEGLLPAPDSAARILVVNDGFGALALSLCNWEVVSWSDSWLSHQGVIANSKQNPGSKPPLLVPATEAPPGRFDLVLVKIPRSLALLEHQLAGIAGLLEKNGRVLGAGMARHIHTSTLGLFEARLGPTSTSLAKKKARLVIPSVDTARAVQASPYPDSFQWEEQNCRLLNHANVFSRGHLDIGARAMLQALPGIPPSEFIVDLGCGNGVLGIAAQLQQPMARLAFIDESYMAVASAQANWSTITSGKLPGGCPQAGFHVNDGLGGLGLGPDLVLCNPPFHQGSAMGDQVAWRMFVQSGESLRQGGQLWVVGNRHMAYHGKLKKLFGNCRVAFSNRKFVVLVATKLA